MLDFLRKRKRSWIIIFFLFAIIVVFIAFYGGKGPKDTGFRDIAVVNGEPISQREFGLQYQRLVQRYRDLFKGSMTPEMMKTLNLKSNLLEDMIVQKLLVQEARSMRLTISDDELASHLSQIPEFQVNGRFNKERYLQLLRANRISPAQFEEEQREQLTVQRLFSIILDSVHVTEAEVRERYRFEHENINLQFIRLSANDFLPQIKVTEEDIKNFYERNKESLKEPLKVRAEYLSYPFEKFIPAVQVSDKEIEQYYQANRTTKFHTPKQVRVRSILISVPPGTDATQKAALAARANRVANDARAGKDFAQLAKQESQDPSAASGGETGWITQGQMPANIEQAVFALNKGEVSNPIETPAGFYVFKLEDVKPEKTQTLKEASEEIARLLRTDKAKEGAFKIANRDREKALSGIDLSNLARESGATLKTTGEFASGEVLPEIGDLPEFYKTAFSLGGSDVGPVIEGGNAYYLIKIKERKEPFVPELTAVRAKIEKQLSESKAHELLLQKANSLLEQLRKERDIRKVAQQHELAVQETGFFLRNAPQIPKLGEVQELTASRIALSSYQPIPERIVTQKDSALLFAFKESQGADMEQFEKQRDELMKRAVAESQQRALQKFKEGLKAKADVQVYSAALEEV